MRKIQNFLISTLKTAKQKVYGIEKNIEKKLENASTRRENMFHVSILCSDIIDFELQKIQLSRKF